MKLKYIGDKLRRENATEASQLSSCLSYCRLYFVFHFVFFFCQKKNNLLVHTLICYSYIKPLILPKAECGSNRSEQLISAKEISLFPTRVSCFWDTVQRLDMWMQLSIHLGNSSIWFAHICTQADFGKADTCIRTRKKARSKHLSRLHNNLFCNFLLLLADFQHPCNQFWQFHF